MRRCRSRQVIKKAPNTKKLKVTYFIGTNLQLRLLTGILKLQLSCLWNFRYYDLKNDSPVTISNTRLHDRSVYVEHFGNLVDDTFFAKKYVKGFVSKDRSPAEQRLVDAYVSYCKIEESVVYCYFPTDKTYSDLFDRSKWRLIEAKAIADRRTVRQAIGQLLDYKRFFSRTPSIGVLLEKPTQTTIELLDHYNITAIWALGLKFKDSSSGNWTTKRIKK